MMKGAEGEEELGGVSAVGEKVRGAGERERSGGQGKVEWIGVGNSGKWERGVGGGGGG